MVERSKTRIGLIGFGEVGASLGLGLRSQGVEVIAYDKCAQMPPFGELIQVRAREADVPLVGSVAEAVRASDLILAMVPGAVALEAVDEVVDCIKSSQMYVDLGTATPPMKEEMARMVEAKGASFVDVAIVGSPREDRHLVPTLASGRDAERYRDTVVPFGMNVTVVGERPGRAAAIKMFRSIFRKGLEALVIETLMACETWDVTDVVMESINTTMGKMRFYPEQVNGLVTSDAVHGERRSHEMEMVIETMRAVGVEPRVTQGTSDLIHWTAGMGLKEHFGGELPSGWKPVIDEVFKRAGVPSRGA